MDDKSSEPTTTPSPAPSAPAFSGVVKKGRGHKMAHVALGTTGLLPAPATLNPVLVPANSAEVGEGAKEAEPVTLRRDTLREQLFRKERQIRNLLFVGDGDGSILIRPTRNASGSTANGQSTTSQAMVTARSRLASVLLPYSGPRPSMANHLCLRSWTLIWAPTSNPQALTEGDGPGQGLDEEDETPAIISTLRKGKVWFDTYSSCFDWLKNELLAIWDLEDVSRSSVSAEFRFGSALLGASTASRFHDLDQQLGSAVRSIEAGNTHLYFLPDNHECLLAAANGVDADTHHPEVVQLTMTVFNKEKLSYVTAHAELVLPEAASETSDQPENQEGRRFRITKVETSGIRLIWTLMAFPEKDEEPYDGEEEKAHSAERDRSGPQPGEEKITNEPQAEEDDDDEEEEEEGEESGSEEDDEEESETETQTQTETQMNDDSDEESSDLGLTSGKRRARYRHVRPIELIFHCNAEKSLAHPTVPFIQSVLKAIATNIDTLCQVAKGELQEEAPPEPSPWVPENETFNSDRPKFVTALLQICKAFHDNIRSTAEGEGEAKRTIYSNPNVPTLETDEYAVTRFKVDCIKRKTIRGIDVHACQCMSVDFAPYRFRQAASYAAQTPASGQGLSRYEELELAARRSEAESQDKESPPTPAGPPPPVGEVDQQPQRETSEDSVVSTPKLPPGIHSHLFQNESVYSIDFDRNVYCTNEIRIDWELLGYRSNEANLEAMEKVGSLCRYLVSEATEERSAKVRETVWKKHQAREEQRKAEAELAAKEQKYQSPRRKVHRKSRRDESASTSARSTRPKKTRRVVQRSSKYQQEGEEPQYDFHAGYRAATGAGKESSTNSSPLHRRCRGTGKHRKPRDS